MPRRLSLHIRLRVVAAALTMLAHPAAKAATVQAVDAEVPRVVRERCRLSVPGVTLECGKLLVRQNRADPSDRRIQAIGYVVLKARKPGAADPVLFLTGGPGSSSFYFLDVLARSPILASRDIIALEQRGNGYSEPNLLCGTPAGDAESEAAVLAFYAGCRRRLLARGVPLAAYGLAEAAADVVDLRRALGIAQWNVLGTSYGSFWALRYLAASPKGVRSVILDSPFPPQATEADSWVAHMNGLSAIFAACAADPVCAAAYPDLRARFVGLIEKLDKTPVVRGKSRITAQQVFDLVHGANFETATVLLVPRLIAAIEAQDFKTVEAILSVDPYGRVRGIDMNRVSSPAVNLNSACIDDVAFSPVATARVTLSESWPETLIVAGKGSAFDKAKACAAVWPVRAAGPELAEPVRSDVPALITVGALDPETPPILGRIMAATLPNATLAVLPDAAHAALSLPSGCASRIVMAFLHDPAAPPDTACLSSDKPRFVLPAAPIAMPKAGR